MWIGIDAGGADKDTLLTVSLPGRAVLSVQTLQFPVFLSLWASCDDSTKVNVVGGIVRQDSLLVYGTVNVTGVLTPQSVAKIPAGLSPTPLLSLPPVYDFFAVMYPTGSRPGDAVQGLIAFGFFQRCCADMILQKISYYLVGAARLT
jgi:hypothetical protein